MIYCRAAILLRTFISNALVPPSKLQPALSCADVQCLRPKLCFSRKMEYTSEIGGVQTALGGHVCTMASVVEELLTGRAGLKVWGMSGWGGMKLPIRMKGEVMHAIESHDLSREKVGARFRPPFEDKSSAIRRGSLRPRCRQAMRYAECS